MWFKIMGSMMLMLAFIAISGKFDKKGFFNRILYWLFGIISMIFGLIGMVLVFQSFREGGGDDYYDDDPYYRVSPRSPY